MNEQNSPGTIYVSVQAVKANDENALRVLYTQNYPKIAAYILQNNGTQDQAKDIYQEAFIALWRNVQLDKFTPEDSNALDRYLFTIAKHKWLDHLRSATVKKTVILENSHEKLMTIEELDDNSVERLKAIQEKFRQLGEDCRKLLTRFYYGKEPLKAIAAAFNWTEATARNNKYRCMEKLKKMVKS